MKIWRTGIDSNKLVEKLVLDEGAVSAVAINMQCGSVACGLLDGTVKVWSLMKGSYLWKRREHSQDLTCIKFSPCGQSMVSAGADRKIIIWSATLGKIWASTSGESEDWNAEEVQFGEDRLLASLCSDGKLRIWSVDTKRVTRLHTVDVGFAFLPRMAFTFQTLAVADDCNINVYSVTRQDCTLQATLKGHSGAINSLAFGPGRALASGSDDCSIRLWSAPSKLQNGYKCIRILRGHESPVTCITWLSHGSLRKGEVLSLVMAIRSFGRHLNVKRIPPEVMRHILSYIRPLKLTSISERKVLKFWDE